MIELFDCIPLGARISKATCEQNRKRGGTGGHGKGPEKIFACMDCPGLGVKPHKIDLEVSEMAADKKRKVTTCSVAGCDRRPQHNCNGMCKTHFRQACTEAGVTPETASSAAAPEESPKESIQDYLDGEHLPDTPATTDPRITFECPNCHVALSSAEVEDPLCPCCDKPLHTHIDVGGRVFTPDVAHGFMPEKELCEQMLRKPVITSRDASPFEMIGMQIGSLVTEKNQAYGNSFAQSGDFLRLLYPDGVKPDQFQEALGMVRIFDKMKRIATDKDAFGEDPYRDIAGYAILAVARREGAI